MPAANELRERTLGISKNFVWRRADTEAWTHRCIAGVGLAAPKKCRNVFEIMAMAYDCGRTETDCGFLLLHCVVLREIMQGSGEIGSSRALQSHSIAKMRAILQLSCEVDKGNVRT